MSYALRELTVDQLFEAQANLSPNAQAIAFEGVTLSYQELEQKANQLANYLQAQGVEANSLVGVCVDRSINLIISVLAILKVGAAYLPLDPAYPPARLQFMVEDSGVSFVITQQNLTQAFVEEKVKPIFIDSKWSIIETYDICQPLKQANSDSLAYVIYTSGSTGKPKGVAMPHRSLVNLMVWQKQQFKNPKARTLQFTPISFDVSFQEIFSTLSCGGTLVLIDDATRRNSEALLVYLNENSVERLFLPFIALQNLAEAAAGCQNLPTRLQEVITAGEQLKITRSIVSLFSNLDGCTLANQYGPSESHVVTQHILEGPPRNWPHLPPIGKPIDNTEIYLLKAFSRRKEDPIALAEEGEIGELAIGGVCLSTGYLNRQDLTASRFMPNPFKDEANARLYKTGDLVRISPQGNIEYVERLDNQVKIRGVRVEIGEIEAQLSQNSIVKTNAVIARKNKDGTTYLTAYIVPNDLSRLQSSSKLELSLREFLKTKLPDWIIPTFFEFLQTLPLTPSGKVDRRALPEPRQNRPALANLYVSPQTNIEKDLAELWAGILDFTKIGTNDNFFELGGDSLRAVQLIHKVREQFKIEIPIVALFDAPTIDGLAKKIEKSISIGTTETSDDISPSALENQTVLDLTDDLGSKMLSFSSSPKKILITGVTGFLGAFLLAELLEQTQAEIYCLVRASDQDSGAKKIEKNLNNYGLWVAKHRPRIKPILGDLSKPKLGIEATVFDDLTKEIDTIYHNGASISLIHPYSVLRAANVEGTEELLRMAAKHRIKPFHFISTLDVFQTSEGFSSNPITESDFLNPFEAVKFDGYTKSKWVSEKMVWSAQSSGLPVCVYRPAMISGHSQTGICNTNDLMNRLIKGFVQLGVAPESGMAVNIAPVDYFSRGVVHLSLQEKSLNKGFNFINPNPVSMENFVEAINNCGYAVQLVDHDTWRKILTANISKVDGIVSVLTSKEDASRQSYIERSSVNAKNVSCENVLEGLKSTEICCPNIDANFLKPYFDYYVKTGFIESSKDTSKQIKILK